MRLFRIAICEDEDFNECCAEIESEGFHVIERFSIMGIALAEAKTAQQLLAFEFVTAAEPISEYRIA